MGVVSYARRSVLPATPYLLGCPPSRWRGFPRQRFVTTQGAKFSISEA
jgi:hypothetical protein